MGKHSHTFIELLFRGSLVLAAGLGIAPSALSQKAMKPADSIPVRYTDVRAAAGITFQQDSTQTEEKYYLEIMGTGVAWIDYEQDGLMDLFFVQSPATDIYKLPHSLGSALYHNTDDGKVTYVTKKYGLGGERH